MNHRPKHSFFFALVILLIVYSKPTFSQDLSPLLLSKSNSLNAEFPQEKIYLHLDRQTYLVDDDIWFKAYILDSPVRNFNLYVELINPQGEIVSKNLSLSQYGLSYGDFHLDDTLATGMYRIRAYTNWMRNFDEQWFFQKDILVINPRDAATAADSVKLKKRNIDLQFFPEGGTFLANQKNRVAFKAIDENGKGIDIKGTITDNNGNKILDIESTFKGIGSFWITPKLGKKYTVNVSVAGQLNLKADLPEPQKYGISLSADATDSAAIYMQITQNQPESNIESESNYFIVGQAGGKVCFAGEIPIENSSAFFKVDKNTLPGGIVKFTLFDQHMIPHCERLVFNNHLDTLHIAIKPNKSEYKPREKVELDITALNSDGTPTFTNLSMTVYNQDSEHKTEEYSNNIFTCFLLDSELKGTIEEPAYYFKDDSLSTLTALDNVMLSHGYRYFEWEAIMKEKTPEIVFQPDSCLQVKGQVTLLLLNKPLANYKVSMISVKSLLNVYETTSDSVGDFLFTNLYFKDTVQFTMQAKAKRDRQNTFIELYDQMPPPEISSVPSVYKSYQKDEVQTYTYISELTPELLKKKWHLSDTILLADVNVVARKKEEADEHDRSYFKADYVIDSENTDFLEQPVIALLSTKFPGVSYDPTKGFISRGEKVKFYMDGIETEIGEILAHSPKMFDKIEYVRSGIAAGINYSGGVIFFYPKRGMKNILMERPSKTTSAKVVGYSIFRKFYSPKYKANETPEVRDDFRRTIYWDPLIRTYSDGKAQVSFYNSDEPGKVNVVVEGINSEYKLCRGVTSYDVSY